MLHLHYEQKKNEIIVQPRIYFLDSCENTIRHHSRYSRKDISGADGDVKDRVKPLQKYKDFCDLVRYYAMSSPRYVEGGRKKRYTPNVRKVY